MESYLAHPDLLREFTDEIQSLVNEQLGRNFLPETQIRESFQTGGNLFMGVAFPNRNTESEPPITVFYTSIPDGPSGRTRGLVSFPDGIVQKPVAVCIGGIFNQAQLASYLNIDVTDYPEELKGKEKIGILRTTAVIDELQRNGIGTQLVTKTVELLDRQNVDAKIYLAWRSPTGVAIHNILTENGLKPVKQYKDYWMEESREESYHCPECGAPPCRCSGILYFG